MQVFHQLSDFAEWRDGNAHRVLVPTMGALHEGHLSLCDRAREVAGEDGKVIVTIFVNPIQFGPSEDLDAYPRTLEADLAACRQRGVDAVFAPAVDEVYHGDASVTVREDSLSGGLCGGSRPGHFDGVCTVVAKLFNMTLPQAAVFGEKDYQQLAVIRRMVRDLNFPIEIIGGATVREADGLAMSSRNVYLSKEEREEAPVLHETLRLAAEKLRAGDYKEAAEAANWIKSEIEKRSSGKIDYIQVVHPETLEPLESDFSEGFRLILATFFGKTRLIDNVG
ncbi:MAG: pantoate--beta-alanine ligase [Verrucomicrobiota bacterium]